MITLQKYLTSNVSDDHIVRHLHLGPPLVLMLTPILLINKKGPLRCYCTAILLSFRHYDDTSSAFQCFTCPGFYDGSNISPLIYNVPVLDNIAQSIYGYDTTSFPSIHITLSFTALMIVLRTSGMRKWSWALSALVALMVFSVIYLEMLRAFGCSGRARHWIFCSNGLRADIS